MQISAEQLAAILKGTIEGDPSVLIDRLSKIEEGEPSTISFLGNPKYEEFAYATKASILIVQQEFIPKKAIAATLIRVPDVYAALAVLMEKFGKSKENFAPSISDRAVIDDSANLGREVFVGDFVCIGSGSVLGDRCYIHPQVYVGRNVSIGKQVILYPGVRIMDDCEIGDHCIIHANAVIGSDGFGFAPQADGSFKKIPQNGNVVIEEQVEIGANVTIDRASIGSTKIRKGVKLDNLVHVAHNVEIGQNTVMAAQVGIAGSTRIGKNCQVGGQVGFAGHLEVADGTGIQAQSGLARSIKTPNQRIFGSPAINYNDFIKSFTVFKKLPEIYRTVASLGRKVKELEQGKQA